jgi:hypothetical protein
MLIFIPDAKIWMILPVFYSRTNPCLRHRFVISSHDKLSSEHMLKQNRCSFDTFITLCGYRILIKVAPVKVVRLARDTSFGLNGIYFDSNQFVAGGSSVLLR